MGKLILTTQVTVNGAFESPSPTPCRVLACGVAMLAPGVTMLARHDVPYRVSGQHGDVSGQHGTMPAALCYGMTVTLSSCSHEPPVLVTVTVWVPGIRWSVAQ